MKTINKFMVAGLIASSLVGCKDRMIELNTNPTTVSATTMPFLFSGATREWGYTSRDQWAQYYNGMRTVQIAAAYDDLSTAFNDPTVDGGQNIGIYTNAYNQYFGNFGNKLQTILNEISYLPEAEQAKYNDIKAITMIMMAYDQWRVAEQYGAMIYDEAFKAITESIRFPKYQLGKDIYTSIDATLKEAIAILATAPAEGNVELGNNDLFYGYTTSSSGVAALGDYEKQRARWMKLANIYRLEMAWKLSATDAAFFNTVKGEVTALENGLMTEVADGFYYNYGGSYIDDYNPDDVTDVVKRYAVSESLVNSMKSINDPRLPYYARPNGLSTVTSKNFRLMTQFFPDSLSKYRVLQDGNIYVGLSVNPKVRGNRLPPIGGETATNPDLVGSQNITFALENPYYPNPFPMANGEEYETTAKDFALSLQVASPTQGRYWVKSGGREGIGENTNATINVNEDMNSLMYDGPGEEYAGIPLRLEIYSYARQCFLLAYLGITTGGKTPEQWFRAGITASLQTVRTNAIIAKVQIAVATDYPKFPGYTESGPYTYTDAQITAFANAQPFTSENVINHAWLASYMCPEYAYQWYKVTGLPKMTDIAGPSTVPTGIYWEQPYKDAATATKMLVPRRNELPDRSSTNTVNFVEIRTTLEATAGFGGTMNNTNGRVWWDVN